MELTDNDVQSRIASVTKRDKEDEMPCLPGKKCVLATNYTPSDSFHTPMHLKHNTCWDNSSWYGPIGVEEENIYCNELGELAVVAKRTWWGLGRPELALIDQSRLPADLLNGILAAVEDHRYTVTTDEMINDPFFDVDRPIFTRAVHRA